LLLREIEVKVGWRGRYLLVITVAVVVVGEEVVLRGD
jgi:hypothetical protein